MHLMNFSSNHLGDSGGCYICMKLLDIPFDNLEDKNEHNELINKKNESASLVNTNSSYKVHEIKINDIIFLDNNLIVSL